MGSASSQPGDLIEFDSPGADNHWGVFIGNNSVVYLSANGVARKGLLNDVAAGRRYIKNNKYDKCVRPLASYQIVANALETVGRTYDNYGPEKFAAILRYGLSSESLFMDPGDLIEFPFQLHIGGVLRQLWAVYVGHGAVVLLYGDNKVTKMSLMVAANGSTYKVNNKYDGDAQPLPPAQIVARALEEVGKSYALHKASPESFVAKMRYDLSCEGPFPKPGDLIEFHRGLYQHWGIYVGFKKIVHFTLIGIEALMLSSSQATRNASEPNGTGHVKMDEMETVANGSRYNVNNHCDRTKKPYSPSQIVSNAMRRVGESKWYHVLTSNCEHFATEVRYGEPTCSQVVKAAVVAGLGSLGLGAFASVMSA